MNRILSIVIMLCTSLSLTATAAKAAAVLGVQAIPSDSATQQAYADIIPPGAGLIITRITPDTPAQQHLRLGDVLLQADGSTLKSPEDLAQVLRLKQAGTTLHLLLLRNGERMNINCPTAERPAHTAPSKQAIRETNKLLILLVPNGNATVNVPAVRRHLLHMAELQLAQKDAYTTCTAYLQSDDTLIRVQSTERALNIRCTPARVPEQTLRADFYHRDLTRLPKELEQLLLKASLYHP